MSRVQSKRAWLGVLHELGQLRLEARDEGRRELSEPEEREVVDEQLRLGAGHALEHKGVEDLGRAEGPLEVVHVAVHHVEPAGVVAKRGLHRGFAMLLELGLGTRPTSHPLGVLLDALQVRRPRARHLGRRLGLSRLGGLDHSGLASGP